MFDKAEKLARKVTVNCAKKALQTHTLTALTGLHILLILHILHILHNLHILHILYYSKSIKILILHPPEHWTYISIGLNSEGGPSKLRVKNLSHKDCMNPKRKIMH